MKVAARMNEGGECYLNQEDGEMTRNRRHKDQLSIYSRLYMLRENADTCPEKAFMKSL